MPPITATVLGAAATVAISLLAFALNEQSSTPISIEVASQTELGRTPRANRVRVHPEIAEASFGHYVRSCSELVHARVERIRTVIDPRGMPHLEVDLLLLGALKGEERSTLTVMLPGGNSGTIHVLVSGAPVLTEGTEIVAFVQYDPSGVIGFLGLGQGVYAVQKANREDRTVHGKWANGADLNVFFANAGEEWIR